MCFHLSATVRMLRRRLRKSFHLRIQPRCVDLCNLNGDPKSEPTIITTCGENQRRSGALVTVAIKEPKGQASSSEQGSMCKMKGELELLPHSVLLAMYSPAVFQECEGEERPERQQQNSGTRTPFGQIKSPPRNPQQHYSNSPLFPVLDEVIDYELHCVSSPILARHSGANGARSWRSPRTDRRVSMNSSTGEALHDLRGVLTDKRDFESHYAYYIIEK